MEHMHTVERRRRRRKGRKGRRTRRGRSVERRE